MRLASGSRRSFVFVIGFQVPNLATQWHFLELQFFQWQQGLLSECTGLWSILPIAWIVRTKDFTKIRWSLPACKLQSYIPYRSITDPFIQLDICPGIRLHHGAAAHWRGGCGRRCRAESGTWRWDLFGDAEGYLFEVRGGEGWKVAVERLDGLALNRRNISSQASL